MPLLPLLAQASFGDEVPPSFAAAIGVAGLIAVVGCLPFLVWRVTRRWSYAAVVNAFVAQAALLVSVPAALQTYSDFATVALPFLLIAILGLLPPAVLMLGRRTRRLGLVLFGPAVIAMIAFTNYWALVIGSIGYLLLLIALWPRWRLLRGVPPPREVAPVVPSRGVLSISPWPRDARPRERGFTLVSSLVGVGCLVIAFGLAAQLIGGTTAVVRRADHLAMATNLLESARERTLAGVGVGDIAGPAAAALPHGTASLSHSSAGNGLSRVTAVATWREADGKPGRVVLEWLAAEGSR
jgi:hypothetical protein